MFNLHPFLGKDEKPISKEPPKRNQEITKAASGTIAELEANQDDVHNIVQAQPGKFLLGCGESLQV